MKKILGLFLALMLLQIGCGKKQGPNLKKAILTFVLGEVAIKTEASRRKANIPYQHRHSEITDSPMGKKFNLNREEVSLMTNLVQKKFAELK